MTYLDHFYQPTVIELARAGNFRAIAYWLNGYLVPQGMWVCVDAAPQSGFLRIVVKVQRPPDRDRLLRFICCRIRQLDSDLIKGMQVVVQQTCTSDILWQHSIRFRVPIAQTPVVASVTAKVQTAIAHSQQLQSTLRKQVSHTADQLAIRIRNTEPIKPAYAAPLGGAAVAAFLIGTAVEAVNHFVTPLRRSPDDAPSVSASPDVPLADTLNTSLGTLPITHYVDVSNQDDTAVTLMFGGIEISPSQEADAANKTSDDQHADVAIAALDSPLSLDSSTSDRANSLQRLRASGIDLVSIASDRILQAGEDTVSSLSDALDAAGIQTIGAGINRQDARRPEVIDVKGQRIAYFGYSDSDLQAATRRTAGSNLGSPRHVSSDIQAVRDSVDWVVVNYHWNQDLPETPTDEQIELAHAAVDHGADLVVGYHPTVLQGAEIYQGRAIAYSLSSFVFQEDPPQTDADDSENPKTHDTAVLKVALRDRQMRVEFLPVHVRESTSEIVEGSEGAAILEKIEQASRDFDQPLSSPAMLDAKPHAKSDKSQVEQENPVDEPPSRSFPATPPPQEGQTSSEELDAAPAPPPSDPFITYPEGESTLLQGVGSDVR
ncbi:MAG: CapA family protein [Elainellaceae cyanobacterium]